jgi:phosphoglycerate kinase
LKLICEELSKKLDKNIKLVSKNIKEINSKELFDNNDERVIMLENIRFYPEEEENDEKFAKHLST